MSKRQFRSHASSGRVGTTTTNGFGGFGLSQSSVLSYVQGSPDYSTISDSNVAVSFKNLSKKDGTTKARGLEELTAYATASDVEIEDAFLDAWARLFPRLSIDTSRRVRQLAHIMNGQVCSKSGKRTVRHMPRIVGPWLAGTFDNDRTVSRAALDALSIVFPTVEKVQGVRKTFQQSILEYCRDSVLHETVKTLSDERVVSSDDAEATYARVVATSLSVVASLLTELDSGVIDKDIELYQEILNDSKIWEFAHHIDAGVRRSMHRLVQVCLTKQPPLIESNVTAVSNSYIYKGLHADQSGSALEFVQALCDLTTSLPQIWTTNYSGKKSVASRLRHFLKQGSQAAASGFWEALDKLLRSLPTEALPATRANVNELLTAARQGVSRREERFNASNAWTSYFTLADLLTSRLDDEEVQTILNTHVMPVVRQYVHPSSETTDWSITGARAAWVVSKATAVQRMIPLIVRDWPALTEKLIETAKTSQPEQSKEYEKSQRHVATTGERWADLQRELWERSSDDTLAQTFMSASTSLLEACIGLLNSRNGKPYGAAAIIEQMLRTCSQRLMEDPKFRDVYIEFAQNDMTTILFSQSQRHLIHGLYAIVSDPIFNNIFEILLNDIVNAIQAKEPKVTALRTALSPGTPAEAIEFARKSPKVQEFLLGNINETMDLFADLVKLGAVSPQTTDTVLAALVETLTTSSEDQTVLSAMAVLTKSDSNAVQAFASKTGGSGDRLLPSLVRLEQSENDEIAGKASLLSSQLSSTLNSTSTNSARYSVVRQEVERISEGSLHIDAVVDLANRLRGPEGSTEDIPDLLPSTEVWLSALREAVKRPKISMALMSPLGAGLYLLGDNTSSRTRPTIDSEGFSLAFRIALYTTELLKEADTLQDLVDGDARIQDLLHISVLVAEDNVSVLGMNDLWSVKNEREAEFTALEFIQEARKLLKELRKTAPAADRARFNGVVEMLGGDQNLTPSLSYYLSLSRIELLENSFELQGYTSAQVDETEAMLKAKRAAKQTLPLIEFLVAHQQPLSGTQAVNRLCNELVADLTDLDVTKDENLGLEQLIVLNTVLRTQAGIIETVAKQRLIFFIKNMLAWLNASTPPLLKVELCRALVELFPGIQDMYGEHWEQALSFLLATWKAIVQGTDGAGDSDTRILLMNASLRLCEALRRLARLEEPNDDLIDALKENDAELRDCLVNLLVSSDGANDESNQPLLVTNELLARQLTSLSQKPLSEAQELYPLMYAPSRPIVQAAFDLLHQHIPSAQEQISFDAAIDKKTAQLPDELLSLILEPPSLESLADVSFERMLPLSLQGYLYSWRLVFDHFNGSSYKVKNDYIEQLKEASYLDGLLEFVFDFLGHTNGKPVDISEFDLLDYTPYVEPSPEKDVQWLLSRLYFLTLARLPSLAKSYYLNIRSRQTSSSIESWTAKHISPLLIESSLRNVAEWSEKSSKDDPEADNMTVKVGMRSKEVQVGYVVDEQTMAIKVVLPDAYPLASAQVIGVSRVAVKEEKWQSWLRNCQGVITFSNGSIIDGLTAWRKNVTGALKGQSECAICYSIIGGDKQLPTKKCPTCKNMFHASCLLKWFKTSNASTCPLCRNPFNFN